MDIQRIKSSINERLRGLSTFFPSTVTIVGSYNTMNAGDRILCDTIAQHIKTQRYTVQIQSKRQITKIRSKYIVVCGGDILHDSTDKNWNFLKYLSECSSEVFFIGSGVPGFYLKEASLVKKVLSSFQLITTRDKKSYERLKAFGLINIIHSVDNAFLKQDNLRFRESVNSKIIVLNIKAYVSSSTSSKWMQEKGILHKKPTRNQYVSFWEEIIKYFKSQGYVVENVSMTKEDEIFSKKYFDKVIDKNHPFTMDYYKISRIISRAYKVVSSRYHFLILSMINHKVIIAFAYADKVENILNDLGIDIYIKRGQLDMIDSILANENRFLIPPSMYQDQVLEYEKNHYLLTNKLW